MAGARVIVDINKMMMTYYYDLYDGELIWKLIPKMCISKFLWYAVITSVISIHFVSC